LSETRKLAAILAADVVGYSRLMGEDEAGTAKLVRERREARRKSRARRIGPSAPSLPRLTIRRRICQKRGYSSRNGNGRKRSPRPAPRSLTIRITPKPMPHALSLTCISVGLKMASGVRDRVSSRSSRSSPSRLAAGRLRPPQFLGAMGTGDRMVREVARGRARAALRAGPSCRRQRLGRPRQAGQRGRRATAESPSRLHCAEICGTHPMACLHLRRMAAQAR